MFDQAEADRLLDEMYRGCRVTVKAHGEVYRARVTRTNGRRLPICAEAPLFEGAGKCLTQAKETLDRYLAFIGAAHGTELDA